MNCRVKHEYHPRTVIYRRLCLARHFSAGFVMLPSVRGFNPMHSPVVSTPGHKKGTASEDSVPFLSFVYLKLSLTLGSEVLEIGCLCLCSLQLFAKFLQVILQGEQEALSVVRRQDDTALNFCLRSTRNYTDKI